MANRMKERYVAEIAPALNKKFGYKSVMQIPKLDKVIVNVRCGESKNNAKEIEAICKDIATITGQKPTRTPLPHLSQYRATLQARMGVSFFTMPPVSPCLRGLVWQVATLTFSTMTLFSAGIATRTLPLTPLSLPDRTITVSFFLMFIPCYPLR